MLFFPFHVLLNIELLDDSGAVASVIQTLYLKTKVIKVDILLPKYQYDKNSPLYIRHKPRFINIVCIF